MADEVKTASGFIDHMIARYRERAPDISEATALHLAVECLRMTEEDIGPFGHPDGDWGKAGAIDLVDEEMSCWDD